MQTGGCVESTGREEQGRAEATESVETMGRVETRGKVVATGRLWTMWRIVGIWKDVISHQELGRAGGIFLGGGMALVAWLFAYLDNTVRE